MPILARLAVSVFCVSVIFAYDQTIELLQSQELVSDHSTIKRDEARGSVEFWLTLAVLVALLFGAWEALGTYLCERGLATNRAWVGQVVLGYLLIATAYVGGTVALCFGRHRKRIFVTAAVLAAIGITPNIVHWLFRPICNLLHL